MPTDLNANGENNVTGKLPLAREYLKALSRVQSLTPYDLSSIAKEQLRKSSEYAFAVGLRSKNITVHARGFVGNANV